jgi:hypothetical protein
MKHKKTITSAAFLLLGLGGLHAQESPTTAGGEATGTGAIASYSAGQVVYMTVTGTNGDIQACSYKCYNSHKSPFRLNIFVINIKDI